jgi:hypothetical protein
VLLSESTDTVVDETVASATQKARREYWPGRVAFSDSAGRVTTRVHGILDMADSVFVANHCFRYERLELRDDKPAHLISFRPRAGLDTPDLAGGFWVAQDLSAVTADSVEVTNLRRLGMVMTRFVAFRSYRRTGDGIIVAAKSEVRYEFRTRGGRSSDIGALEGQHVRQDVRTSSGTGVPRQCCHWQCIRVLSLPSTFLHRM